MRKFVVMLLVTICLLSGTVSAKTTLEVMPTYRYERFIWNKADLGGYPNVLSELKWEELRIRGVKGVVRQDWGQRFLGEIVGSYGLIYSGHNQDSDYDENDRQGEFSRTYASGGGTVVDGSLAVGWKWQDNTRVQTNLLGGYAISRQVLTMHDGVIVIPAWEARPIPGLDTRYKALWRGPWLGVEHKWQMNKQTNLTLRAEYHWLDYRAEAYWNLRKEYQQPVTNNHWARARGTVVSLGIDHIVDQRWTLGAQVDYTNFKTFRGTDQINYANGSKVYLPLNEAEWISWAFRVKAMYKF